MKDKFYLSVWISKQHNMSYNAKRALELPERHTTVFVSSTNSRSNDYEIPNDPNTDNSSVSSASKDEFSDLADTPFRIRKIVPK